MRALTPLVLLLAACTDLSLENGKLRCSTDQQCPAGYYCAFDDHCWLDGTGPDSGSGSVDLAATGDLARSGDGGDASAPDLAMPDLLVVDRASGDDGGMLPSVPAQWTSGCGATQAQASMSNNRLDVSVGGVTAAATVSAQSGNQLQIGYLPVETK
jgi:hypothetical protein